MPQAISEILAEGIRRQTGTLIEFATTPVGPFQTLDRMVANARRTIRDVTSAVGIAVPALRGHGFLRR